MLFLFLFFMLCCVALSCLCAIQAPELFAIQALHYTLTYANKFERKKKLLYKVYVTINVSEKI